jgi:uncharacterized protein
MFATRTLLPNQRWHFQHGPIDLIIGAVGEVAAVAAAHEAAWQRFQTVLPELVGELHVLRSPVAGGAGPKDDVARAMFEACSAFAPLFITPMAAVAGAVADEIITAYRRDGVRKAWVNNGGDIAFHLAPGCDEMRLAVASDPTSPRFALPRELVQHDGLVCVTESSVVRGVATSGWNGRSFSLGIADAVTVLATTAARADAAATMIANAIDVDSELVRRAPAISLRDDSDLGEHCVTVYVPSLPAELVESALAKGLAKACEFQASGLIESALLQCQGQVRQVWVLPHESTPVASRSVIAGCGERRLRYAPTSSTSDRFAPVACAA